MKIMKKILVVDDDKDIIDALEIILETEGYIVSKISNGDETYKIVKDFNPNLILLDILMSGNDGRSICKILKSNQNTSSIPIILMSAHPLAVKEYSNYGGDAFLPKPFDTEELLQIVKEYIN